LDTLNDILRSPMIREIKKKIAEYRNAQKEMIVVDMAILFEAGLESLFDIIVVVSAPEEKRIHWLEEDREWSPEEIRDRMDAQMDVRYKEQKAHIVVQNAGSLDVFRRKARDFYRQHVQPS
jgi:dephospho-CoA kinase